MITFDEMCVWVSFGEKRDEGAVDGIRRQLYRSLAGYEILRGGRARDAPFVAQMLLARMLLLGGHEQSTAKGAYDGRSCRQHEANN